MDEHNNYFTATNLIKVGNFLRSIGFGDIQLTGNIELSVDDFLFLKKKLVDLELRKPKEPFESIDSIPITYRLDPKESLDGHERTAN